MYELYHQMKVLEKFYTVLEELRAEVDMRELNRFLMHCDDLYSFDSDDFDEILDCTDKCKEYQDTIKSILSELF
jgi:hypothetical protein